MAFTNYYLKKVLLLLLLLQVKPGKQTVIKPSQESQLPFFRQLATRTNFITCKGGLCFQVCFLDISVGHLKKTRNSSCAATNSHQVTSSRQNNIILQQRTKSKTKHQVKIKNLITANTEKQGGIICIFCKTELISA